MNVYYLCRSISFIICLIFEYIVFYFGNFGNCGTTFSFQILKSFYSMKLKIKMSLCFIWESLEHTYPIFSLLIQSKEILKLLTFQMSLSQYSTLMKRRGPTGDIGTSITYIQNIPANQLFPQNKYLLRLALLKAKQ